MEKDQGYVICQVCHRSMSPRNGCLCSRIMIGGKEYDRIKFGDTPGFDDDADKDEICHDCNAGVGQYHHVGCDMERCPVCRNQLISCGCDFDAP